MNRFVYFIEHLTWILFFSIMLFSMLFISRVLVGDFVLTYPFMWPDSFDWLTNGYYLKDIITRNESVIEPTIRQPLLPVLIAIFGESNFWT